MTEETTLTTMHAQRIAVLGDLSGHLGPLLRVLGRLGVTFDGPTPSLPRAVTSWPDDLAVVQVGDLVHKGPDSDLAVAVVHDLLLPTGRWVQLAGNHEVQYVEGGHGFWTPRVHRRTADAIAAMWHDGRLRAAVAVDDDELGPVLITHAGLTPARYDQARSRLRPDVPGHVNVATWLNTAPHDPAAARAVVTPGAMAGFGSSEPGVTWTEPRRELRLPWQRWASRGSVMDPHDRLRALPFSQVHGHAQPLLVAPRSRPRVPSDLAAFTVQEADTGHVVSSYLSRGGDRVIVGIDPGANARRTAAPVPRMLSGRLHV